jgi:hypothetical protein
MSTEYQVSIKWHTVCKRSIAQAQEEERKGEANSIEDQSSEGREEHISQ